MTFLRSITEVRSQDKPLPQNWRDREHISSKQKLTHRNLYRNYSVVGNLSCKGLISGGSGETSLRAKNSSREAHRG